MWFGNPLLSELKVLIGSMEMLKHDLLALEDGSIQQHPDRQKRVRKHIGILTRHINHYSDKELELFGEEEISRSCTDLLKKLKKVFGEPLIIRNIREIVELIERAEEIGIIIKKDIKFELAQKQKAQGLTKRQLNPKERGCYHFADFSRVLHVLRKGLISVSYAKREFGHELEQTLDNIQGSDYLSVFDTYSYWVLYKYFSDKKILPNIKEGIITEEVFRQALSDLPQLNFSKFSEENIGTLRKFKLFSGNAKNKMHFEWLAATIRYIEYNTLETFPGEFFSRHNPTVFLIDDTSELFPNHPNAYAFEGLFKDHIPPEKIVGIIMIDKLYKPYLEEFVKFVGIPLYDVEGRLIWPN